MYYPPRVLEDVRLNCVIQIVREQCWLNEILLGCKWSIEGLKSEEQDIVPDDTDATEEELQAVLAGMDRLFSSHRC